MGKARREGTLRLLLLSPSAVGQKFDQLVLRLQFLICVDGAETQTVSQGLATVDTEHLTLQHVFNSIYTRQASGLWDTASGWRGKQSWAGGRERQGSLSVEACRNLSRRTEHDKRG